MKLTKPAPVKLVTRLGDLWLSFCILVCCLFFFIVTVMMIYALAARLP